MNEHAVEPSVSSAHSTDTVRERLRAGNARYLETSDPHLRKETAEHGQHPYAIVICCSDSRVIPEQIFSASLGELFVIRIAGNVLDRHQLGSIEYAAEHLGCHYVILLGHTGCGAVAAALSGGGSGYVQSITDAILEATGSEQDPLAACRLNVAFGVRRLKAAFSQHPAIRAMRIDGAIYDILSGEVTWL